MAEENKEAVDEDSGALMGEGMKAANHDPCESGSLLSRDEEVTQQQQEEEGDVGQDSLSDNGDLNGEENLHKSSSK